MPDGSYRLLWADPETSALMDSMLKNEAMRVYVIKVKDEADFEQLKKQLSAEMSKVRKFEKN